MWFSSAARASESACILGRELLFLPVARLLGGPRAPEPTVVAHHSQALQGRARGARGAPESGASEASDASDATRCARTRVARTPPATTAATCSGVCCASRWVWSAAPEARSGVQAFISLISTQNSRPTYPTYPTYSTARRVTCRARGCRAVARGGVARPHHHPSRGRSGTRHAPGHLV